MLNVVWCVIRRDLKLALRRRSDVLTTLFFFIVVVTLFPLGVGPEPELLRSMAPGVLWVSALKGNGCDKVLPAAQAAAMAWQRQLTPAELQRFWVHLKRARTLRELNLVRFEQVGTKPPRFTLTIRRKEDMPRAVGPWVEGQLRGKFKFEGSPISVRAEGVRGNQAL